MFKLFYYVEYCLLLKALLYIAIELNLNNAVCRALMEISPLTETASSALPLPSTPMWKRAISFTGISSRFLNVSDTLLVSETEHTNGQPETDTKIALLKFEFYNFCCTYKNGKLTAFRRPYDNVSFDYFYFHDKTVCHLSFTNKKLHTVK